MTASDGELFRWRGETARLGAWRAGDRTAYLAPLGVGSPPSLAFLERSLERLRALGYGSVVTSAILADQSPMFEAAGFSVHQHLHFLDHDLVSIPDVTIAGRRGRTSDRPAVAALDQRCFDGFWSLDVDGLSEIIDATPASRFRVVMIDDLPVGSAGPAESSGWRADSATESAVGPVPEFPADSATESASEQGPRAVGYAISGRSDGRGYLQRLAVDSSVAGLGVGWSLVADALGWMRRRGVSRAHLGVDVGPGDAASCGRLGSGSLTAE